MSCTNPSKWVAELKTDKKKLTKKIYRIISNFINITDECDPKKMLRHNVRWFQHLEFIED